MIKSLILFILGLFFFNVAFGQKDTAVYYLQNSGKVVSTKDSADFFLVISPPDTTFDSKLFVVKEFYTNGKIKLIGGSKWNTLENLRWHGPYTMFFENGHRMMTGNYEYGKVTGDEIDYYPNGKLYTIKSHMLDGKVFLKQDNDSSGNTLAENGKGNWIEFNENFTRVRAQGPIENGLETGVWHGQVNDSVTFVCEFDKGTLVPASRSYIHIYKSDNETLGKIDSVPEFPGGLAAFYKFFGRNLRYPAIARENNTQGTVAVSFIIEKDGRSSTIKILRGIGDGCDEELVFVIKLLPSWKPGMQNGKPARVECKVSASFSLSGNGRSIKTETLSNYLLDFEGVAQVTN